ncbi:MAG: PAS domain S-box protein [Dehalococcoidia bacterium]|jgi:PAS domain S-box-containing protein|nr:PAS domain S-box protein [Dehalococcoidia bacterium]
MTEQDKGGKTTGLLPRLRRRMSSWSLRREDSDLSGRSRLLSALLLLLFVWGIAWALFLRFYLMRQTGWSNPEIRVSVVFALAVVLAGLLNRRGRYLPAAVLAVGLLLAGILASSYFTLTGAMEPVFHRNDAGLLTYLVLPVVIGAVLLPPWLLLVVLACSLGAVLAVPFLFPHMSWSAVLYGPLIYLAVVCGLLAVISYLLSAQQRRNYEELQEKEERYRSLFEQSPDANFLVAPDGVIRAVNSAARALFGYGVDELEGQHVKVLYANPADRGPVIGKTERQGHLYDEPVRLRTKDGRVLDCLLTIWLRKDAGGRTLEYQTIVRDVTSRMQSEEELKLRGQLLDVAQDAVFLVDPGGEIVFANRATSELTGYDMHELVGMNVRRLNTREGAELVPSRITAMQRDGGLDFETTYVRKDGSRVQVEVRSRTIESRGRTLFLSVCRDVTRRKADEAELRLRGALLDLANDAVFLHDFKGKLLYVNEAAAAQRGYTRDELMHMTLRDLDDAESAARFRDHMAELMNRRSLAFEGGHRCRDGRVMPVEVRARLVESGGHMVVLAVVRDISERKQAEAALKAERDRAQGYLDVAAVMLVVMDADGKIALLNRRGAEMLGAEAKDLIGCSWIDTCVPEEQRDYVRSVFNDIMAGKAEPHEHVENDIVTASGGRRTFAWHNAVLRDAAGRPTGTLSSGEDVTERRATERALQLSEQRFRAIYEQSIDAIFENAPDGTGMLANRAWMDLFGYAAEDAAGMNVSDVYVNPADRESYVRTMQEKGAVRDEVWLKKKDGTAFLCQRVATVRRDASGKVVAFQGVVRDITALRNAELALRRSEEKFRQLFEQSLDATWILRPDGTGHEVNHAWLDMFGYSREDLEHLNAADLYAEPSGRADFVRQMEEHGFVRDEVRLRRKDGTIITTERAVVARRDETGRVVAYQGVNRDVTEQRRAEQALRESEEKHRALFEQSLDAIWSIRPDGTGHEVNQAWLNLFGYTREEAARLNPADLYVDPADREVYIRRLVETGWVEDEVRNKRKDGSVIICQRSVVARKDEAGRIIAYQGVARDITERKRAEQALADELTRRRILVEQSRDGIVVLDQDGRAVETNRRFAEMLGYTPEEVLQLHVRDWDVPTPPDRLQEMIRTVDESGDHFETQHRRKDGTVYDVEISTNAAVFSGRKLIFCVCRDITKRKRAEQALRESELRFRALVEHTGLGFTVTRTDGTFLDVNDVFLQMIGYTREELLRLHVPDVYASLDERERVLAQGIRDGFVRGEELEFRRKDGSPLYVSLTSALVPLHGETVVISEFLDVTQRKETEDELRRSEEELRMLAGRLEAAREEERTGIARELHDQLGQALTALKFDLDGVQRATEQHADISPEKLNQMMKLLDDTTDDVRRISSELRPGILDDVGLVAAMEWELAKFGERTGIQCRLAAGADDAGLDRGRSTAVFRVLQELLTNVARHAKAKKVTVDFVREGGSYVLTVADDGVGITPEQASSPLSLGLIGMRERVRPFGGSVEISGKKGGGTTVRVVLPAE